MVKGMLYIIPKRDGVFTPSQRFGNRVGIKTFGGLRYR